ncbi:glycosyltransferase [Gracilibacillus caseinilyticus]|uniref:Glycosyltransferase n=1 Tax=Gracilibacillus caseinilyticus TaxID=2932256 RepID=A0ABY4ESY7_9BACI|nr:glycosyltransferase [Gracilibacillus caseinilyticus]UOQ46769.1 glycosyltransferase [Gracilibacillus caseinilyticus]
MPTSFYQAIPEIMDHIIIDAPKSILDIGVGFGKYGVLLREQLDIPKHRYSKESWKLKLEGIEGYKEYRNPIHDYVYDKVHYGEISEVIDTLESYDTVILIDVLEHFEKKEGLKIIQQILEHTNKSLIISTPLYPEPQGSYLNNSLETHKSKWNLIDLTAFDFNHKLVKIGENGAQIFKIYPTPSKEQAISLPKETNSSKQLMKIGFILPHFKLTGGVKSLLQQMEQLKKKGHQVYLFYKGEAGDGLTPDWYDIEVDGKVYIPPDKLISDHLDICDIVVLGWISQVPELLDYEGNLLYLEQGHEWLFGDIPSLFQAFYIRLKMKSIYTSGIPIISISKFIASVLEVKFQIKSDVIPIGVDTKFYYPTRDKNNASPVILLVGNPELPFKGFDTAIRTLNEIYRQGYSFHVKWVCQSEPNIDKVNFPLETIVLPDQKSLSDYYRQSDLFLFTSLYEGFGLPPLEAMASGIPVVMTKCGGVEEYATEDNCIQVEVGDIDGMVDAVALLLDDPSRRDQLGKRARETALKMDYQHTIQLLESYMRKMVNQK